MKLWRRWKKWRRREERIRKALKVWEKKMDALQIWRVTHPPAQTRIDLTMAHVRTESRERKRGRWLSRLLAGGPAFKMRLPPKREDAA